MATYPQYAPEFRVQINDQDMPAVVRSAVTSVRYEDGRDAADRVEIGIGNSDLRFLRAHIRGLGFPAFMSPVTMTPVKTADQAPEGTFDIDNKISLSMGYAPGALQERFVGEITGVRVSSPNGGMPTMTFVSHDS